MLYKGKRICYNDDMNKACIFNIQKFSLNDGPGIRTVVFFKGCPLRCAWCSNPESQRMESDTSVLSTRFDAREMSVDEVYDICMQDLDFYLESGGGVTAGGGEASLQADFVSALFRRLREAGVSTAIESCAYCSGEALEKILGCTDYLHFDLKHWDDARHIEGTGVSNARIIRNIKKAVASGGNVLLRIPVIPGFNDREGDADGFSDCIADIGLKRVQLLPFHQFGEDKYEKLGMDYRYKDVPALHREDLEQMIETFGKNGIEAYL